MLHEFITMNRKELVDLCRAKVTERFAPSEVPTAVNHGAPMLPKQIAEILRREQLTSERPVEVAKPTPTPTEIGGAAALHGAELLRLGYSIDQVVHDYGDVCQAVTNLAFERKVKITVDEFRTLNRCLDNAIAEAVTAFGSARQILINGQAQTLHDRQKGFSDEHRRLVDIAI
ncbi:MAG: hypothetical protein LH481_16400 [Burkholderiales bacterium]|nr:hypothetical protein [Burkholderiales bacterium]